MVLITFIPIIQRCHPCSELRQNITSITTSKFTAGTFTCSELRQFQVIQQHVDLCACNLCRFNQRSGGVGDPVDPAMHMIPQRSEEHTSELQSRGHLVCRRLLEKTKT